MATRSTFILPAPLSIISVVSTSSLPTRRRRRLKTKISPPTTTTTTTSTRSSKPPNLRRLTSRIVQLTRRRQLQQIFEEIEIAKRRYGDGKLNTIVMNAVMEACVHCGDIDAALRVFDEMSKPDSCGVDDITYATLLKGLGEARRIDEAFRVLESVEQGTAVGSPKLSPLLITGLLNALIEAVQEICTVLMVYWHAMVFFFVKEELPLS